MENSNIKTTAKTSKECISKIQNVCLPYVHPGEHAVTVSNAVLCEAYSESKYLSAVKKI